MGIEENRQFRMEALRRCGSCVCMVRYRNTAHTHNSRVSMGCEMFQNRVYLVETFRERGGYGSREIPARQYIMGAIRRHNSRRTDCSGGIVTA